MSKLCCGYERGTPYCPICGEKINEVPLIELLNYVKSTAGSKRTSGKAYIDRQLEITKKKNDPTTVALIQKRIDRAKAKMDKWDSWAEALDAVVGTEN